MSLFDQLANRKKVFDHRYEMPHFLDLLKQGCQLLEHNPEIAVNFIKEMQRFLPTEKLKVIEQPHFWTFVKQLMNENYRKLVV